MSTLKFKLTLPSKRSEHAISYRNGIFLIGSCFSENIGAKLNTHLFKVFENPHGILFNPISVVQSISDCINKKQYTEDNLFKLNEVWNSWHHHSRFSGVTANDAIDKINESITKGHAFLKSADHIVITLGSAWLYKLNTQSPHAAGQVVANNHKAPATWFDKELMKSDALVLLLKKMVLDLLHFNPHLQIIFTISPVRHLREGLVENNRSKAVLIQAVHEIVESAENIAYFPSYEYVIDDLRDYRFYAEDLVHPNYAASNYVWEKWVETYMNEETQNIMKQVAELQLAMQHKPFFAGSQQHRSFLENCIAKSERLLSLYPYLPLNDQVHFFKQEIAK
ncbi:MAG: GSCFA domain-containing protein [Chitinophagia bacterium]|nr:GSCFA domain-containing protein [Chitinophagia bacterium]NDD16198.1 GSCFA domain-containing protein [Chitinophagia bacterium]